MQGSGCQVVLSAWTNPRRVGLVWAAIRRAVMWVYPLGDTDLCYGVLSLVSYSLGSDVLRTPKSSSGGLMEGSEEIPLLLPLTCDVLSTWHCRMTSHHGAIGSTLL